jgi:hypothetical protein
MNETELKEQVYKGVIALAVTLVKNSETMTSEELTKWINANHHGFQHPYGDCRGVLQAAFRRAQATNDQEGMDALVKAFTSINGSPLWSE